MSDSAGLKDAISDVNFSDWSEVQDFTEDQVVKAIMSSDWLAAHDAQKRAEWEAEQQGRRQFTAAYTTQSGVVCPFGFPTVVQADAQAVADEFSREDPDGPNYFVATRILPPWLPVTNTESEGK